MRLIDEAHPRLTEAKFLADPASLDDRSIEIGLIECVTEAKPKFGENVRPGIKRDRSADRLGNGPELVDAVAMVAMSMRDDHAVEAPNRGGKQLLAKVGPAVDQHPFAGTFDQDRPSLPGIAR